MSPAVLFCPPYFTYNFANNAETPGFAKKAVENGVLNRVSYCFTILPYAIITVGNKIKGS